MGETYVAAHLRPTSTNVDAKETEEVVMRFLAFFVLYCTHRPALIVKMEIPTNGTGCVEEKKTSFRVELQLLKH